LQVENSTVFATGGGSGLAWAMAKALAEAGANAVLADVNQEAGEQRASEIGSGAKFVRTDVADEQSVQDAPDSAVEAFGDLDGVVNCATIGPATKVIGKRGVHELGFFTRTVETNLVGTFNVIRLAAARMARNEPDEDGERGVIVNTASVAAYEGQIGQAAYAASKGGVVALTLPVARELAASGIRVVTIAPRQLRAPDARGAARGGEGLSGPAALFSAPSGPAGGVRHAGETHRREPDAQRSGGKARRWDKDGPALGRRGPGDPTTMSGKGKER
jgi:NAD(P)-dependent dehydrogenase (short-subunit alcohol dehydrogenase family)